MKIIFFFFCQCLFILALLTPSNSATIESRTNKCPENVESAISDINEHLAKKQWVDINFHDCPEIQEEIANKSIDIINRDNFSTYLSLMNKKTLRIVRNTFFAKKGYVFKDSQLTTFFSRFAWYHPSKNAKISLSDEEKKRVDLLKNIEDKLEILAPTESGRPSISSAVKVLQSESSRRLVLGEKQIDITPKEIYVVNGYAGARVDFSVVDIPELNSILVCRHELASGVDSISTEELTRYSQSGVSLGTFYNSGENRILGLEKCPTNPTNDKKTIISYSNAGCCGARWDALVTFDLKMQPIMVVDCGEGTCAKTDLFTDIYDESTYYFVSAHEAKLIIKDNSNIITHEYEQTMGRGGPSYDVLYKIKSNGALEIISEAKKECKKYINEQRHWANECKEPYPRKALFNSEGVNYAGYDDLATLIYLEDRVILFWENINSYLDKNLYLDKKEYLGTTTIPTQN